MVFELNLETWPVELDGSQVGGKMEQEQHHRQQGRQPSRDNQVQERILQTPDFSA
jgi:hypothetical protein